MKKLIALLLAMCLLFGLVACGGGDVADPTGNTGANSGNSGNSGDSGDSGDSGENGGVVGGAPAGYTPTGNFQGKKLQIWGYASDIYNDFTNMGKGNYIWMIRAAVAEWAELNGVTVEYVSDYNQAALLASIQNGDRPDILFQHGAFPAFVNLGLAKPFSEEQYNFIASLIDAKHWLEPMRFNGEAYGVLYPMTAPTVTYYNKSMFERYDVKTPREYFEEGKWNYTAIKEIAEQMSRDLDGDGVKDTYLMSSYTAQSLAGDRFTINEDGTISHKLDDPQTFDGLGMIYEGVTQKQWIGTGVYNIATNVTYPMFAIQFSDAEFYNFEHLYTTLKNGDKIEVCPRPYYDGAGMTAEEAYSEISYWDAGMHILKSCDEDEAVIDLMGYILRCSMKYLEDYSMGLIQTDYEGITGASDYSAKWLKKFQSVCKKRAKDLEKLEEYDEEYVKSLLAYEANATKYTTGGSLVGTTSYTAWDNPKFAAIVQVPPASSIPLIRPAVEAMVQQYNELYAPKK